MSDSRLRRALISGAVAVLSLGLAGSAIGAAGHRYAGKTSQGRKVSFRISGGYLRHLSYHIYDRCPGGQAIVDFDRGFMPVRIERHGNFGGKFVDPSKATAIVKGKVSGKLVKGALTDTAKHPVYHTTCHGHATFDLKPA